MTGATVVAMMVCLVIVCALARETRPSDPPAPRRAPHPLRYRAWAGLGLWLAATVADCALAMRVPAWQASHGGSAGSLSAGGFIAAFAWSLFDPARQSPRRPRRGA